MTVIQPSSIIIGVYVVDLEAHADPRGTFTETWRRSWVPGARDMLQANQGDRSQGSLVGFHYHLHQADYWYFPRGHALVMLHDLRTGSPTDGATLTIEVDDQHRPGIYVPPGVAHAFYAHTDLSITYLVDQYYNPDDELGVTWNDPAIGAAWPTLHPLLSKRDRRNAGRSDLPPELRPRFVVPPTSTIETCGAAGAP
jgi:dTDP-4-dehydrorhamnose 3,5-epimerase